MKHCKILLTALSIVFMVGCSKGQEQLADTVAASKQGDVQEDANPTMTPEERRVWRLKNEKPQPIVDEPFYDPATYKEWRAQFYWQHPLAEGPGIWSTNLEGKDLRRAVTYDLLKSKDCIGSVLSPVVRSPDNRYVAFSVDNGVTRGYLCLVDLKQKTVKSIAKSNIGMLDLMWGPDSNSLLFYLDNTFSEYLVDQDKVRPFVRDLRAKSISITRDGKIYTFGYKQYEVYNFKGERLEEVKLVKKLGKDERFQLAYGRVSWDGKSMVVKINRPMYILDLTNDHSVIFQHKRGALAGGWLGPNRERYYYGASFLLTLNMTSLEDEDEWPNWIIQNDAYGLALFNMQEQ